MIYRFQLRSDVSLKDVVSLLPDNLTGADLYSVCSQAWAIALRTQIHNLTHGILLQFYHFPVVNVTVADCVMNIIHLCALESKTSTVCKI